MGLGGPSRSNHNNRMTPMLEKIKHYEIHIRLQIYSTNQSFFTGWNKTVKKKKKSDQSAIHIKTD